MRSPAAARSAGGAAKKAATTGWCATRVVAFSKASWNASSDAATPSARASRSSVACARMSRRSVKSSCAPPAAIGSEDARTSSATSFQRSVRIP